MSISDIEARISLERSIVMQEAMQLISYLFICSNNSAKIEALINWINETIGVRILTKDENVISTPNGNEPSWPSASSVSKWKATSAQRHVMTSNDDVRSGREVFAGSDVAHRMPNGRDGVRLERYGLLSDEKFEQLQKELIQMYCYPQDGVVTCYWEISTSMINGNKHTLTDVIEVRSNPVDEELLRIYLQKAREDGSLYSSNAHFKAIECLIENGKILTVCVLPKEFWNLAAKFRHRPENLGLGQLIYAIVCNVNYDYPLS